MPTLSGTIQKLKALAKTPLEYYLPLSDTELFLNPLLGQTLHLQFLNKIECIGCGKNIKKSYQQGYCFPCTQTKASCDICIVRPEKCHFHLGTCREPQWGEKHCMIPHIVYLANTSGLKVGITRETQIPTRWIDQGATQALPIARVYSRYTAGLLEVALTQYFADKTVWRKMLGGVGETLDLKNEWNSQTFDKAEIISSIQKSGLMQNLDSMHNIEWMDLEKQTVQEFIYPVNTYPNKIKSLSLSENEPLSGALLGIKGQYLIFDSGVINIRNIIGYFVEVRY